jgi:4-amino-4-deoxychorismate lyase
LLKNSFLETIKSIDGRVSNISYHQKRYESVLSSLGISVYKNLQEYLHPPSSGLYRCRLVYTLDSISVTYHAYTKRDIHSLRLVYDNTIEYAKKLTARDRINELFELREECDDILIVKNGRITDTSIANVAFYKNDIWYTPASPLLRGTTRQRLLDEGFLHTADINVEDLKKYSQIALLNAMIDFDIIASISYKY